MSAGETNMRFIGSHKREIFVIDEANKLRQIPRTFVNNETIKKARNIGAAAKTITKTFH